MAEHPVTDEQIDKAYHQALSELEPSELVDQRIQQLAHSSVLKNAHWSAFSVWARVASLAGVAVLGWWLLTPGPHSSPESEVEVVQLSGVKEGATKTQAQKQSADEFTQSSESMEVVAKPRATLPEDAMVVTGIESAAKPPAAALRLETKSTPTFRQCLQSQLASQELPQAESGLPEGVRPTQLEWAQKVRWQNFYWRAIRQGTDWYLVRAEGTGWQQVKLPEHVIMACQNNGVKVHSKE